MFVFQHEHSHTLVRFCFRRIFQSQATTLVVVVERRSQLTCTFIRKSFMRPRSIHVCKDLVVRTPQGRAFVGQCLTPAREFDSSFLVWPLIGPGSGRVWRGDDCKFRVIFCCDELGSLSVKIISS